MFLLNTIIISKFINDEGNKKTWDLYKIGILYKIMKKSEDIIYSRLVFYIHLGDIMVKYIQVWGDYMTKVVLPEEMDEIKTCILRGDVVAFPTETVYGLGAQFGNKRALDQLFAVKNRDQKKAVTLMLSHIDMLEKYAYVDERIMKVAQAFMPGRITLVLKRKENVDPAMTNGLPTIGIRIPDSPFVLNLINEVGPLSVTSANLSGGKNTTNEKEVLEQLEGRIPLVVKGQTSSSLASTVVKLTDGKVEILREGAITKEDIEEVFNS